MMCPDLAASSITSPMGRGRAEGAGEGTGLSWDLSPSPDLQRTMLRIAGSKSTSPSGRGEARPLLAPVQSILIAR